MHFLTLGCSPIALLWSAQLVKSNNISTLLPSSSLLAKSGGATLSDSSTTEELASVHSLTKTLQQQNGVMVKFEGEEKGKLYDIRVVTELSTISPDFDVVSSKKKSKTSSSDLSIPLVDVILVMTDVPETEKTLQIIQPFLNSLLQRNVLFICLQHGLGNVEMLMKHVPKNNILIGTTITHATSLRDGLIRGTSNRPSNVWSASGVLTDTMKQVIKTLNDAGLPTTATPEAEIMLWKKMAVNCSINTVSAICSLKIGSAWNDAQSSGRNLMLNIAKEVAQVAQLEGIKLTEQEAVDAVTFVAQKASNHVSAMCNDVLNAKETEIETLNGYVLRCAKKHNLKVPACEHVFWLVSLIQDTYRKRLKPLVSLVSNDGVQEEVPEIDSK